VLEGSLAVGRISISALHTDHEIVYAFKLDNSKLGDLRT